eukprot:958752-Alexandrium_andersonii.AAC.1
MQGRVGDLEEVRLLLSRAVRRAPEGALHEAGPRHAEQLILDLVGHRVGVKAVFFPGYKRGLAN